MNNIPSKSTATSRLGDRMERIYYLTTGIKVLSDDIAANCISSPFDVEEVAYVINAMAWEISAECAAITDTFDEHTPSAGTVKSCTA